MVKKSGPKDVDEASRGSSPVGNSGGGPGHSFAQKAIPGPEHTGLPISMKRALAKKSQRGGDATGYAGSLKPAPRAR
jgi:hypothetical protein